jgi:hypothetical protein
MQLHTVERHKGERKHSCESFSEFSSASIIINLRAGRPFQQEELRLHKPRKYRPKLV